MSFTRLNSGEFPPLNQAEQLSRGKQRAKKKQKPTKGVTIKTDCNPDHQQASTSYQTEASSKSNNAANQAQPDIDAEPTASGSSTPSSMSMLSSTDSTCPKRVVKNKANFIRSRVGWKLIDYTDNLTVKVIFHSLKNIDVFIVAPIEPARNSMFVKDDMDAFQAVADLELNGPQWQSNVALDLGCHSLDDFDVKSAKHLDLLIRHSIYLSIPVIFITCPNSDSGIVNTASIINERFDSLQQVPTLLVKVLLASSIYQTHSEPLQVAEANGSQSSEDLKKPLPTSQQGAKNAWSLWNSLRSHLIAHPNIGVCLEIHDDIPDNRDELERWCGEPVRVIMVNLDQFVTSPGHNGQLRLSSKCREFVYRVVVANSLNCALVLAGCDELQSLKYLPVLQDFMNEISNRHQDPLLDWNDVIQTPLQPLSAHLDSMTYRVFEADSMKYLKYRDAMIEALEQLIMAGRKSSFVLMVLGAGRGPLVDAFIDAIRALHTTEYKFTIYALDKNPSSVRSLKYKQKFEWMRFETRALCETHVIQADMRHWQPQNGDKADIIASELLGSLADNELSPECLEGAWRLATPETISIPQDYASYVAPICSFKLHQQLYKMARLDAHVFDTIYVSRINNYYAIDEPQQLFQFQHQNLSREPQPGANERYKRLAFRARVDTLCTGFGGYFVANLFGTTSISTCPGSKTANMDSWFPAFVPLEQPVELAAGAELVLHFWRRESATQVWYQWAVTAPVRTRIYSLNGVNTAMSKFVS